jgi:3-hydroxyisobutyrate dehydrogenase
METKDNHALGWIGTGRMGSAMSERLAKARCNLSLYNRTRSKAEPLAALGAKVVDTLGELAHCDIVFIMVSTSDDLKEVLFGAKGLASSGSLPKVVVDCSTVSMEASAEVREKLTAKGVEFLAAPVSGSPKVVKAGKLSVVASGPNHAFEQARPYIDIFAPAGVSYVGEGELSRVAKICANIMLGVVAQNLAEITVLAERAGLPRSAFLAFINSSVVGSIFTRYKSPAYVNLDYTPTFTPFLLRKDMDLGLEMARKLEVAMPVATASREVLQAHLGQSSLKGGNYRQTDIATLLDFEARCSGVELKPENIEVWDGLSPKS